MKQEIIDANTTVAKASYKLSEISFIYPITPSSTMAEVCDQMANSGEKNIFGNIVDITEMQSEAGAIGAIHGASLSGSVSSTFTSSQGLLLMLPNMYKIAGEMLPVVINVASRSLASHSLNIFCDHSDVMSARQTGFAMLASGNPQESYDFAVASFLTSMKTRIPFLHFFDGFRTSHQISTINTFEDDELKKVYPFDRLQEYQKRAISPNNPKQYGTSESQDIFFQGREKSNLQYKQLPKELEKTFADLKKLGAKEHHIMEYFGSPNAKYVICVMASASETVKRYIEYANEDIGLLKINLYRPFDAKYFLYLLPESTQKIAVLDRTKEQGSLGEPLYLDVCSAVLESERNVKVFGGRFGLGGKEFSPAMVKAVFDNLKSDTPKNHFTIGIDDDITKTSLVYDKDFELQTDTKNILIYGMGSDGSVSCAKNLAKIFGEKTDTFVEAYFMYDSKKSGSLTRSYISIDNKEINRPYLTTQNDIVACSNASYLAKYNIAKDLKQNGIVLINSKYKTREEIDDYVLNAIKKDLAEKNAKLFSIDANKIAEAYDLKGKVSAIMQMAILKLSNIMAYETAKQKATDLINITYSKKSFEITQKNIDAIDDVEHNIFEIEIDKNWKKLKDDITTPLSEKHIDEYVRPILDLHGDELPVSKVNLYGENETGTSNHEKRDIAQKLPKWDYEKCIQCGKCSFVCPHAVLRAKLLNEPETKDAPKTLTYKKSIMDGNYNFHLEVSPMDCLSCGLCESVCPVGAINMVDKAEILDDEKQNYDYTSGIENIIPKIPMSPAKAQFLKPYFEFSGACAGCGETPYIRLLTQLFGNRIIIANATGCSSIYGGSAPTCPYTKDQMGFGPAWANSLFEDNAEFGLGIEKAQKTKRENFKKHIETNYQQFNDELKRVLNYWLENFDNYEKCQEIYLELKTNKDKYFDTKSQFVLDDLDLITPKSVWLVGGDGWAYDIDFGGLDHVFQSGENINILVLDTELYSNTGGQKSKASPMGASNKFCIGGKKVPKKNLTLSALQYKDVYVASVCLGADMNQVLKAFDEAQKYNGVSLIVAYAPCINHGIDMSKNIEHEIEAVKCGYWHLFRYNPDLTHQAKNPFVIDSPKPTGNFEEYLMKERRFVNLFKTNDKKTIENAKKYNDEYYELLLNLQKIFEPKK